MNIVKFASKSCSSLLPSVPASLAYPVTSNFCRKWSSSICRDEYLKLKKEFVDKFHTKQQRFREAVSKLVGLPNNGDQHADPKQRQDSVVDCEKNANLIESDIKMNCLRSRGYKDDNQIMIAVDKIAEGGIKKIEKSKRSQAPWRNTLKTHKSDTVIGNDPIAIYRE